MIQQNHTTLKDFSFEDSISPPSNPEEKGLENNRYISEEDENSHSSDSFDAYDNYFKEDEEGPQDSFPYFQKLQTINPVQHQVLYCLKTLPKDHVCTKKLVDLSKPKEYVKALCYIPEKNRLLALFTDDHRRIKDYNTNKLSLVTTIICKRALSSIRYCPHLSKTLALTANNEI